MEYLITSLNPIFRLPFIQDFAEDDSSYKTVLDETILKDTPETRCQFYLNKIRLESQLVN